MVQIKPIDASSSLKRGFDHVLHPRRVGLDDAEGADQDDSDTAALSEAARSILLYLRERGASFFADIARGTKLIKAEAETALWELVTAGIITADGFDNFRALIDPRRRAGKGSRRFARPRHSVGRWSILHTDEVPERERALEAVCSDTAETLRCGVSRNPYEGKHGSALARIINHLSSPGKSW